MSLSLRPFQRTSYPLALPGRSLASPARPFPVNFLSRRSQRARTSCERFLTHPGATARGGFHKKDARPGTLNGHARPRLPLISCPLHPTSPEETTRACEFARLSLSEKRVFSNQRSRAFGTLPSPLLTSSPLPPSSSTPFQLPRASSQNETAFTLHPPDPSRFKQRNDLCPSA